MRKQYILILAIVAIVLTSCNMNQPLSKQSSSNYVSSQSSKTPKSSSSFVPKISKQKAFDMVIAKIKPLKKYYPFNDFYENDIMQESELGNRYFYSVSFLYSQLSNLTAACFLVDAQTGQMYIKLWTENIYLPIDKMNLIYLISCDQTKDGPQKIDDIITNLLAAHGFNTDKNNSDILIGCFGIMERNGQVYYVAIYQNSAESDITADNIYVINKKTTQICKWDIVNDSFIPFSQSRQ